MSDLLELAERVEALEAVDFDSFEVRKLNEDVLIAAGWRQDGLDIIDPRGRVRVAVPPVLTSLDAAMTLVPDATDTNIGRLWCIKRFAEITDGTTSWRGEAVTEALALTAAALRARGAA